MLHFNSNPQIHTKDTRLSMPPRVMASSAMDLILGVLRFLPTTPAKASAKQMRSRSSCPAQLLTPDCLHAQTAVDTANLRTWRTTFIFDEPRLFWLRKKPKDPQIEPHGGIKIVQGLVSLTYICVQTPSQSDIWLQKYEQFSDV